jgi:hypothetical protein
VVADDLAGLVRLHGAVCSTVDSDPLVGNFTGGAYSSRPADLDPLRVRGHALGLDVGFGRIVVSETNVPNMLVNLV